MQPKILYDADEIAARVRVLGARITEAHAGHPLVLVSVLKGSFIFAADLARAIDLDVTIDFLGVRSYGENTTSTGVVELTRDLSMPIEGQHVLLVEDIVDTGLTMRYIRTLLGARAPASLELASLLHKPSRMVEPVTIDYLGFTVPDVFVVGYGLDDAERYRNLPYLGYLETP